MFTASGTIRYSPKRETSDQNWWLVLDCDAAIGEYYRHLFYRGNYSIKKLAQPFWGAHITVVRNEEPLQSFKPLWGKHESEQVEFHYHSGIKNNYSSERYRSFYWLDVQCDRFDEIRKELGLSPASTAWKGSTDYHLTIGSWENPERKDWYEKFFKKKHRSLEI